MQISVNALSLDEQLTRDLARGTSDLPELPRSVQEALRLARDPAVDPKAVVELADRDPPLTARILSVANSVVYRRGSAVSSVKQALVRIGQQTTRDLLYQIAYASMVVKVPRFSSEVEASFRHGVATSKLAREIAERKKADQDLLFVAALLHDVGRPRCLKLIVSRFPHADEATVRAAVDEHHQRAGAQLAEAWRLPPEVVEVCATHHAPASPIAILVAAADALSRYAEGKVERPMLDARLAAAGLSNDLDLIDLAEANHAADLAAVQP
jgi:putative nucleotidyltransferase with HDIG domain